MRSVQEALLETIQENELLQFGLANRLFNLSQLAKYLKPSIEVRVKKDIQEGSLTMALSRAQRSAKSFKNGLKPGDFSFSSIQVASNLCIHTYLASKDKRVGVIGLLKELQAKEKFISFTHSLKQITIFFSKDDLQLVEKHISGKPLQSLESVAVIGGVFDDHFAKHPGLFNAVFQHLYTQGVNILEVSSTFTELQIYVNEKDMRLAFDTLYARFVRGYER